ncbi:DUF1569 domain-containing protein [Celeribacter arenosi]|uniref:DUF1569 domain-containing protein n=1 Tax=Celeribacter arenosi TaxID=792649 RepID=A0ABP7JX92_9RHOB
MFTKYIVTGAFLGVAGGGYYWLNAPRDQSHLSLDLMLDKLDELSRKPLETSGSWDASRTFHHLAQSVEFSMTGYPQPKPAVFQKTVGKLAYKVFNARGAMSHGLDEVIPGEVVTDDGQTQEALIRLKTALMTFREYGSDMKPHFAYGRLSKDDYSIAHVLHINNHLEEFRLT